MSIRNKEETLLFSVASPLFFKISAIVTTVAIAAQIHVKFLQNVIPVGLGVGIDEAGHILCVQLVEDVKSVGQTVYKLIFSVVSHQQIKVTMLGRYTSHIP